MKLSIFTEEGYALWDVCGRVKKKAKSSLDSDIEHSVPNDIFGLLRVETSVKKLCMPGTSSNFFEKVRIDRVLGPEAVCA